MVLIAALFAACSSKSQFTLTGTVVPEKDGTILLYGFKNGQPVPVDSAKVENGEFKFKGDLELPDLYLIGYEGERQYIAQLFLEPGEIEVSIYPDSLQSNTVIGSESQDLFKKFMDETLEFSKKEQQLRSRYSQAQSTGNKEEIDAVMFEYDAIRSNLELYARNFVTEYNDSPVSAYVYLMNFYQTDDIATMDSMLTVFDPSIKESQFIKVIEDKVNAEKSTSIGAVAPDFTIETIDGKSFTLSSLKGQYVLIDFWASWCQPCMREMPNVIEQYGKYSDKGFQIVGISLDRQESPWKKAIADNKMNWIHAWDLADPDKQGEVANIYGVQSIPSTFLLDKNGKIIAKNLRGEELAAKLAELLD